VKIHGSIRTVGIQPAKTPNVKRELTSKEGFHAEAESRRGKIKEFERSGSGKRPRTSKDTERQKSKGFLNHYIFGTHLQVLLVLKIVLAVIKPSELALQ
jgi:hypothetical protein